MKNWKLSALLNTPLRLILALGLLILVVELFIMTVIGDVFISLDLPDIYWQFFDAILLTIIISPALYSLVFQKLQSEERFRQINASVQDAIVIVNEQGSIIEWNPAAQRIFQYSQEEAIGQQMHQLLVPSRFHTDAARDFAHFQQTGQYPLAGTTREIAAVRKDGSELSIELSLSAFKVRGRRHSVAVIRDITERKRAENVLRKLSQAVEQSPSAIIITDLDANIEYANAAFVKVTGYSLAEAIGQNPRILQSGKTPKATYDDMWAHLTRGEAWNGEFINRRKDGSEYIESMLISPVRQPDGRVTNYLAIKEDITLFKQAQEALRDSRENLNRLLNSMAEGAYGVDTNGICTFVNRAFLQMLGYQGENEVLGKHTHELMHHSHADGSLYPESECEVYRAYRTNQSSHVLDEVFWRKDGVAIPVECWAQPIVSGSVVTGAIVTFIDITERKNAEANLAEQFNELCRWHAATSGREGRILELKHEVNKLLAQAGQPLRYPSAESQDPTEE